MIQNGRMTLEVVPDWRWTPLVSLFSPCEGYVPTDPSGSPVDGRTKWWSGDVAGGLQAQKCPQHEVPRSRDRRQDPCLDRCHSVVLAGKLSNN
jgi:hypothetical protein